MPYRQLIMVLLALVSVSSIQGGCSWLFVTPPPTPMRQEVSCTRSPLAPSIDAVLGGAFALSALACLAQGSGPFDCRSETDDDARLVLLLLVAPQIIASALTSYSSYYGFRATTRCRDALSSGQVQP